MKRCKVRASVSFMKNSKSKSPPLSLCSRGVKEGCGAGNERGVEEQCLVPVGSLGRPGRLAIQQNHAASPCTAKGCFPRSLLCVRSPCRPQGGHRCSLSLEHLLSLCSSRGSLLNLSQFPGVVLDMLGTEEGKRSCHGSSKLC